ncbi:hypothetical protein A9Q83_07735 [Alphaproteobacteria bacterium 46_93_T64]|nr:hypothetical protein A9Q83_07735 [Alphaproteobacteria bacterium 46_93_T64]
MTEKNFKEHNMFLDTPLGPLFAKTAVPIIIVMLTNGLYTVVDGWFIGRFVGPEALSAVTMVFPLYMMLIALGTLVSSGFSSVLARALGAGRREYGEELLVSAIALSAVVCISVMLLFSLVGDDIVALIANGSDPLAAMGYEYLAITFNYSALFFLSALLSDSLRSQGKVLFMAAVSLLANVLNMIFNYFMIVELDFGVAGSAYGTALAQTGAILAVVLYQYTNKTVLRTRFTSVKRLIVGWKEYLVLGAPISLTYIGVSASTASTIYQLQVWNADSYETTVAAYGIIMRIMTFGYMPLLGMTLAQQSIVGNNFGAKNWDRTYKSLKITTAIAAIYCLTLQVAFILFPGQIAGIFVDNPIVISETIRILPITAMLYFLFGPLLMFPSFFQSIGDAGRAALLGLSKIYLITIPLILFLPSLMGEVGIWYAGPLTEITALILTIIVLLHVKRKNNSLVGFLAAR